MKKVGCHDGECDVEADGHNSNHRSYGRMYLLFGKPSITMAPWFHDDAGTMARHL